jgi:glutathionylspermidine synthase
MLFLARRMERHGLRPMLIGPDQLRWTNARAEIDSDWHRGPVQGLVRFFPAEWLPNLPRSSGWRHHFAGSRTPLCNPATALLTQSKRFPLVWDRLKTDIDTWRQLLPQTHDPREVRWNGQDHWVLKPALGRVGDGILLAGVTPDRQRRRIARDARWHPRYWVAQRRFDSIPLAAGDEHLHVCLGVFTVDGRAAGVYGRASASPLIDHLARDVAVLVEEREPSPTAHVRPRNVLPATV